MNEHRLSRILGYDGMRAAKRAAAREESPAHEKKESAAFEAKEHKGYDAEVAPDNEAFVSKAISRAKGKPGKTKNPRRSKDPGKRPPSPMPMPVAPSAPAPTPAGPPPLGMDGKNWIKGAIKHPGALHKQMGVPEGQKIPKSKLAAAASKGGTLGRRARLAETLGKMHHDGYTLKDQTTKEGSFDGSNCLGTDGSGGKMEKTMHEFKHGQLHSGSKQGPLVTNRKQAIAIGMNQARKAGEE